MPKFAKTTLRYALTAFVVLGMIPAAAWAGDLSSYRGFHFGTDLTTVAKLAGVSPSQAKVVHLRPALIQELAWRPRPLAASAQTEPAKEVVFTFYNGELFQIAINYDRYQTEGMTTTDFIEAISSTYGAATKPAVAVKVVQASSVDQEEEVLAQWQDPEYRFDLIRSRYGPSFQLVGVLKRLEAPVETAIQEAKRLDIREAPQRDAERAVREEEAERVKLDKARLLNKPKFRP